jgi:acyl-CoA synthetase (NDP forming)
MGFQVPSARMKMFDDVQLVEGPVAFVSQSGGHARLFLLHGPEYGIGFSKVISFGNALLTDATDFLEYLADDAETRIICIYLEGIKDGGRFTKMVREVNQTKPVIIWKGGLTTSGARAASSHTGSLGGDRQMWEAFFKQTGAVQVNSLAEMIALASTMIHLRPTPSVRSAVLVAGGGTSVATGDVCAEEGLELPRLSQPTKEGIREFISLVNQGVSNPLDIPAILVNASTLGRLFDLLADDPLVDVILLHLGAEFFMGSTLGVFSNEQVLSFARDRDRGPQVVVAVSNEGHLRDSEKPARELREAGIMAYSSLPSACQALRRFAEYHRFAATGETRVNLEGHVKP